MLLVPLGMFAQEPSIKIGILIPDRSSSDIIHATELALEQANEKGGFKGTPFEMVVRTTEGPWGAGSKESVSLVFDDKVSAMLCALDGRNAHLAEQVSAKTYTVCIETRATESSLTQAYVPWFMRCVPSDDQQSRALLKLINASGGGKTAILCHEESDAKYAAQSFIKMSAREGNAIPVIIKIKSGQTDYQSVVDQLKRKAVSHLIIPFHSPFTIAMIRELRVKNPHLNIYGTLAFTMGIEPEQFDWESLYGMHMVSADILFSPRGKAFQESFNGKYGYDPGVSAAYAYDGMGLLLEAIRRSGPESDSIRKALSEIRYNQGVTGDIKFDQLGNRTGEPGFIQILEENYSQ